MKKPVAKNYHHGGLREALVAAGRALLEGKGAGAAVVQVWATVHGFATPANVREFILANLPSAVKAPG